MSELSDLMVVGGGCPHCGMTGGVHKGGCDYWDQLPKDQSPPVYDLAEFERQLEAAIDKYFSKNNPFSQDAACFLTIVRDCLRASKREAK